MIFHVTKLFTQLDYTGDEDWRLWMSRKEVHSSDEPASNDQNIRESPVEAKIVAEDDNAGVDTVVALPFSDSTVSSEDDTGEEKLLGEIKTSLTEKELLSGEIFQEDTPQKDIQKRNTQANEVFQGMDGIIDLGIIDEEPLLQGKHQKIGHITTKTNRNTVSGKRSDNTKKRSLEKFKSTGDSAAQKQTTSTIKKSK